MEWNYVVIAILFVVGVVLAFPLAIGICAALGALLIGLDRFSARCPGFSHLRRWHQRRLYRPGQIVSVFLAPDVRRDVEVVDASGLDTGLLAVRTRTWNVLYAIKGLAPEPPFGEVRMVAMEDLWAWSGKSWGGPVPEGEDDAEPSTALDRGGR
ncbi:MAG TPA: hypothetical protein VGR35_18385 [Tepidisphaeraceae bacterium]|nr:hypothetical protein [Tepidisphaeraceae bacterium]